MDMTPMVSLFDGCMFSDGCNWLIEGEMSGVRQQKQTARTTYKKIWRNT